MLPADYYSISPEHPHWPLILMLVLTQLSVGAFTIGCILEATIAPDLEALFRPLHATNALILGLLALAASTCHLGRPLYAFRGILGWRHSWLSREILFFGLFAGLAVPYAIACWIASVVGTAGHCVGTVRHTASDHRRWIRRRRRSDWRVLFGHDLCVHTTRSLEL